MIGYSYDVPIPTDASASGAFVPLHVNHTLDFHATIDWSGIQARARARSFKTYARVAGKVVTPLRTRIKADFSTISKGHSTHNGVVVAHMGYISYIHVEIGK